MKRFEEKNQAKKEKIENIRKQQMEKERSICTNAPKLNDKKNTKIKKNFLERQKEYSDIAKKNKDKLAEKVNKEKLKDEEELKKYNEKISKKYQNKGKESIEQGIIQRLYKDDIDKRAYKKQIINELSKPVFMPNFIPDKLINNNKSNNKNMEGQSFLYESIREKEEVMSKTLDNNMEHIIQNDKMEENISDTKQLMEDLVKEENQEIMRNKLFRKVKNAVKFKNKKNKKKKKNKSNI